MVQSESAWRRTNFALLVSLLCGIGLWVPTISQAQPKQSATGNQGVSGQARGSATAASCAPGQFGILINAPGQNPADGIRQATAEAVRRINEIQVAKPEASAYCVATSSTTEAAWLASPAGQTGSVLVSIDPGSSVGARVVVRTTALRKWLGPNMAIVTSPHVVGPGKAPEREALSDLLFESVAVSAGIAAFDDGNAFAAKRYLTPAAHLPGAIKVWRDEILDTISTDSDLVVHLSTTASRDEYWAEIIGEVIKVVQSWKPKVDQDTLLASLIGTSAERTPRPGPNFAAGSDDIAQRLQDLLGSRPHDSSVSLDPNAEATRPRFFAALATLAGEFDFLNDRGVGDEWITRCETVAQSDLSSAHARVRPIFIASGNAGMALVSDTIAIRLQKNAGGTPFAVAPLAAAGQEWLGSLSSFASPDLPKEISDRLLLKEVHDASAQGGYLDTDERIEVFDDLLTASKEDSAKWRPELVNFIKIVLPGNADKAAFFTAITPGKIMEFMLDNTYVRNLQDLLLVPDVSADVDLPTSVAAAIVNLVSAVQSWRDNQMENAKHLVYAIDIHKLTRLLTDPAAVDRLHGADFRVQSVRVLASVLLMQSFAYYMDDHVDKAVSSLSDLMALVPDLVAGMEDGTSNAASPIAFSHGRPGLDLSGLSEIVQHIDLGGGHVTAATRAELLAWLAKIEQDQVALENDGDAQVIGFQALIFDNMAVLVGLEQDDDEAAAALSRAASEDTLLVTQYYDTQHAFSRALLRTAAGLQAEFQRLVLQQKNLAWPPDARSEAVIHAIAKGLVEIASDPRLAPRQGEQERWMRQALYIVGTTLAVGTAQQWLSPEVAGKFKTIGQRDFLEGDPVTGALIKGVTEWVSSRDDIFARLGIDRLLAAYGTSASATKPVHAMVTALKALKAAGDDVTAHRPPAAELDHAIQACPALAPEADIIEAELSERTHDWDGAARSYLHFLSGPDLNHAFQPIVHFWWGTYLGYFNLNLTESDPLSASFVDSTDNISNRYVHRQYHIEPGFRSPPKYERHVEWALVEKGKGTRTIIGVVEELAFLAIRRGQHDELDKYLGIIETLAAGTSPKQALGLAESPPQPPVQEPDFHSGELDMQGLLFLASLAEINGHPFMAGRVFNLAVEAARSPYPLDLNIGQLYPRMLGDDIGRGSQSIADIRKRLKCPTDAKAGTNDDTDIYLDLTCAGLEFMSSGGGPDAFEAAAAKLHDAAPDLAPPWAASFVRAWHAKDADGIRNIGSVLPTTELLTASFAGNPQAGDFDTAIANANTHGLPCEAAAALPDTANEDKAWRDEQRIGCYSGPVEVVHLLNAGNANFAAGRYQVAYEFLYNGYLRSLSLTSILVPVDEDMLATALNALAPFWSDYDHAVIYLGVLSEVAGRRGYVVPSLTASGLKVVTQTAAGKPAREDPAAVAARMDDAGGAIGLNKILRQLADPRMSARQRATAAQTYLRSIGVPL